MGHSEEIERILREMEENDGNTIPISEVFLFFPNNSIISVQTVQTDGDVRIGKFCHLLGNLNVKGKVFIGDSTQIQGDIQADGEIYCGKNVTISGAICSSGAIRIDEGAEIGSDITAQKIHLSKSAITRGTLLAKQGIVFIEPYTLPEEEPIQRVEEDLDLEELLNKKLG
jgi:predicted acyltransferase (DUF342 family)